ncbi:uncharacterized protein LOC119987011 isoform X2 [Tripterygium wilfordii]|uniref:uncharacterized protein LOC119987011 isoform X2 n=1 Tax=Tripterygium wilfordii TaxID=458696 RepID=UPI0018F83071|nr:uncharacterized protein LOC119987011 isoform X2 [Tripterygium wilfordii]
MEKEVKQLGVSKSSSSSSSPYSRLSPSAIPFISNRCQTHQNWGFGLDGDFTSTGYDDCECFDDRIDPQYSFFEGSSKDSTFPASLTRDHQSLQTNPAAMSSSNGSSKVASYDRRYFQLSCLSSALKDSSSSNSDIFPNPVYGSSRISTTYPAPNTLSKNVDSNGDGADRNNEDYFNGKHSNRKEPYVLMNVKDNKFCQDEVLVDLCNGRKNTKPLGDVAMGPLAMENAWLQIPCSIAIDEVLVDECKGRKNAKPVGDVVTSPLVKKTELQITGASVLDDLSLRPHCSETKVHLETSSVMSDQNDSDVDSPCWRGLAATRSRFEDSGLRSSQLENEEVPGPEISQPKEACSSLNPWAPQFIPSIAKRSVGYCGSEIGGDNTASQQNVSDLAATLLLEEPRLEGSVTVLSSHSETGNMTRTFNTCEREKEYTRNRNSSSSSMLDSSLVCQPLLVDDHFIADGLLAPGPDGGGSVEGVKDSLLTDSNNALLCATAYEYSPASSEVVVPKDFTKEVHGASKLFPAPLQLDVQTAVNTMHNMSEILIRHCLNDLHSFNEHEYDIIKSTIDNLNFIIRSRDEQRAAPQPSHLRASNSQKVTTDVQKCSNVESQVIRENVMTASPERLYQDEHAKQRNYAPALIHKVLDSCHPSIIGGVRKDNELTQVIKESMVKPYLTKEETQPLALLYRDMWLEASAELRLTRPENVYPL